MKSLKTNTDGKFVLHFSLTQQGGRPGAGGRGGGGLFGFGQTTAKVMKDDIGVRFK